MTTEQELKVALCGYLPWGLIGYEHDNWESFYLHEMVNAMKLKDYKFILSSLENCKIQTTCFKPILYPLYSLTKPIVVKGYNGDKPFVPMKELLSLNGCIDSINIGRCGNNVIYYSYDNIGTINGYLAYSDTNGFVCVENDKKVSTINQAKMFDILNQWKIDYRNLIGKGLAIDVNTLDINPYE